MLNRNGGEAVGTWNLARATRNSAGGESAFGQADRIWRAGGRGGTLPGPTSPEAKRFKEYNYVGKGYERIRFLG